MHASNERETVVVIGNGMVGYKVCEYLVDGRETAGMNIVCFGEEPRPAYDRVNLSKYFSGSGADELTLADKGWYEKNDVDLRLGDPVVEIDRAGKTVYAKSGAKVGYDRLIMATGSVPFVPPFPGADLPGVFVYRTIEDLEAIEAYAKKSQTAAVIGGGLLGLEAAKALYDLGCEAHVVEFAPGLMMRQLDAAGADLLASKIEDLGVRIHLGKQTDRIVDADGKRVFRFADGGELPVDMVVISAGIRPRQNLAEDCGLELGPRGGIAVDDTMRTSDPDIFAVGECASHNGMVYGLVAPGYQMADVCAAQIGGSEKTFTGADMSTKLKLLGVDVASIGESTAPEDSESTFITVRDDLEGVYKKLIVSRTTGALRGAVLVGDVDAYARLLQAYRSGERLANPPISLIVEGGDVAAADSVEELSDDALICTCNNVTKGAICSAVSEGCHAMGDLKKATQAATGCGGCMPQVKKLLDFELAKSGIEQKKIICPHFPMSRRDLFEAMKINRLRTFDEVIERHGIGDLGCEVCKPAVSSIIASLYAEPAIEHQYTQDTNDRFLANIQRGGTYSVVPRIPGGEVTPEGLIAIGEVAKEYDLYVKITGGQRIDMFGARVDQLPDIWSKLVDAGFESGHAYAKALRTVKSCVGSTWCRYGVLDSVGFAITVENRYKGLRAPHKIKSAVSGCIRECAEARCKDFGIIATSEGWNLYVAGNGGANPKHAELLAGGLDDETCLRYVDRFLMYYIHTADPLTRTARWFEDLEGGMDHLRAVVIDDSLGICDQLDADMQNLVDNYECEWAKVVNTPALRERFKPFVNADGYDKTITFAGEREQKRPASGGGKLSLAEREAVHV